MSTSPGKLIFLDPLSNTNTLSSQLMQHTGSTYNARDFYSDHLGPDASCTSSGILVHRESGQRLFVPIKAYAGQKNDLDTLTELVRIDRFENGVGGYQWGDTNGPDGHYGGMKLDALVDMGLALRTGGKRPNGLGGVWPEVQVTDLGREVIGAYKDWKNERTPSSDQNNER